MMSVSVHLESAPSCAPFCGVASVEPWVAGVSKVSKSKKRRLRDRKVAIRHAVRNSRELHKQLEGVIVKDLIEQPLCIEESVQCGERLSLEQLMVKRLEGLQGQMANIENSLSNLGQAFLSSTNQGSWDHSWNHIDHWQNFSPTGVECNRSSSNSGLKGWDTANPCALVESMTKMSAWNVAAKEYVPVALGLADDKAQVEMPLNRSCYAQLPSVGTRLLLPSVLESSMSSVTYEHDPRASQMCDELTSEDSEDDWDGGTCCENALENNIDAVDGFDINITWRNLPAPFQKVPCDIGELAYKKLHRDVVRAVLSRLVGSGGGSCIHVVAALAAEIIYETWSRRQLGKLPRTTETFATMTTLLTDDVHGAVGKLSPGAMEALSKHLDSLLSGQSSC